MWKSEIQNSQSYFYEVLKFLSSKHFGGRLAVKYHVCYKGVDEFRTTVTHLGNPCCWQAPISRQKLPMSLLVPCRYHLYPGSIPMSCDLKTPTLGIVSFSQSQVSYWYLIAQDIPFKFRPYRVNMKLNYFQDLRKIYKLMIAAIVTGDFLYPH